MLQFLRFLFKCLFIGPIQVYVVYFESLPLWCVRRISGGELFERIIDEDFELTEREVIKYMLQIIDGVNFIHKQGIVHLDLKPENIMCVNKTGSKIKLIDFGLARRLGTALLPVVVSFVVILHMSTNDLLNNIGLLVFHHLVCDVKRSISLLIYKTFLKKLKLGMN